MKNKISLLAATSIFMATSANATTTVTAAQLQTYGQAVVDYVMHNPTVFTGVTAADLQILQSTYGALATSSQLSALTNVYNSALQSSAGCAGLGSYPNLNSNNLTLCTADMVTALGTAGYATPEAAVGAGIAIAIAAGMPLTVGGATIPVTTPTPTPTPTPIPTPIPTPVITPTTPTSVAHVVSQVVTPLIQRATSIQQATTISNVISNIFSVRVSARPGVQMRTSLRDESFFDEKGMAAGNSPAKLNAWFNVSETSIGNTAVASSLNGNVNNALGGVDYMFSPDFVAGVSLGYDRVAINYNFLANSGLSSEGWTVAPYASYRINDKVSVDGAYGYASGTGNSKASGVVVGQGYTRNFFTLNLNGDYWMSDWQLTGKANYISAEEKTSSTNRMEQLRMGGQIGYWTEGVMPYASITYVNDLKVSSTLAAPAATDKDAWVAAIGVNLFSKGALFGGVSYTYEFDRANTKNNTLMANIGYRF